MIGNLYVISAPSGAGKTTLVKALVESLPGITVSISHTTRPKRPAEIHGVNYYFITATEFSHMTDKNEFLEHAIIFNHAYGTSRTWVNKTLNEGFDVILEIDWQGCQQIQKLFPECISIFILPPTVEALSNRLTARNQDSPEIIKQRLGDSKAATTHIREYDYVVLNDDFATAVNDLKTIVLAGRLNQKAQVMRYSGLISDLLQRLDKEIT